MQPNRGTKRHCGQCGANFYDLNRTPAVCPKCHSEYVAGAKPPPRATPRAVRVDQPVMREEEPDEVDAFAEDEVLSHDVEADDFVPEEEQDEGEEDSLRD